MSDKNVRDINAGSASFGDINAGSIYSRIINARIVTPDGVIRGYLLWDKEGRILSIGTGEGPEAGESFDAGGAWLVPGGIDSHVHFGGFGEIPITDDFYHGSLGALAGGTTTVMDFCEPAEGESSRDCIARRRRDAAASAADYSFHFVLTEDYQRQLKDLAYIRSQGIGSFKLFTIYPNTTLTREDIAVIWDFFAREQENVSFLVHGENPGIIAQLMSRVSDPWDIHNLAAARPPETESRTAEWLKTLQKKYRTEVCMAHCSAGETVRLGEKSHFLLETCPHYLTFTEEKLREPQGALYTMTPPLRSQADVEELWRGILDGRISILSTDHCPYRKEYKMGRTYDSIPCGVDGVQVRMIHLFSEGVLQRGLSMEAYVRLTSENAARFYHLYPRKGCLQPGSDADLTVIDPDGITKIDESYGKSSLDGSIYQGKTFRGRIAAVFKGGKMVYNGEDVLAKPGTGNYIPAHTGNRSSGDSHAT